MTDIAQIRTAYKQYLSLRRDASASFAGMQGRMAVDANYFEQFLLDNIGALLAALDAATAERERLQIAIDEACDTWNNHLEALEKYQDVDMTSVPYEYVSDELIGPLEDALLTSVDAETKNKPPLSDIIIQERREGP